MRLSELKQPPSRAIRERIRMLTMVGVVLPVAVLLVLQTTRFSVFPGKAHILWTILDVFVFGPMVLIAVWEWMERRNNQPDTR